MANIAFLIKESGMSFFEVMELPYAVFLSLLKHFKLFILMQNHEFAEELKKAERLKATEPDWDKVRPLTRKEGFDVSN